MMEFVDKDRSYRIDGDLAYFAGAITTNELIRDGQFGYDTTNNRLYIREQGIVKYVAMTWLLTNNKWRIHQHKHQSYDYYEID